MPDDMVAIARGVTRREFSQLRLGGRHGVVHGRNGWSDFPLRSASLQGRRVRRHIQRAGFLLPQPDTVRSPTRKAAFGFQYQTGRVCDLQSVHAPGLPVRMVNSDQTLRVPLPRLQVPTQWNV